VSHLGEVFLGVIAVATLTTSIVLVALLVAAGRLASMLPKQVPIRVVTEAPESRVGVKLDLTLERHGEAQRTGTGGRIRHFPDWSPLDPGSPWSTPAFKRRVQVHLGGSAGAPCVVDHGNNFDCHAPRSGTDTNF